MRSKTEDDTLKEDELHKIVQNIQAPSLSLAKRREGKKLQQTETAMTLQERIEAQKKKLRQEKQQTKAGQPQTTHFKSTDKHPGHRKNSEANEGSDNAKNNQKINMKSITKAKNSKHEKTSDVKEPERGERQKDLLQHRHNPNKYAKPVQTKNKTQSKKSSIVNIEKRFDDENFTKSATAFNTSLNAQLSVTQSKAVVGDVSFTEQLLERNNISNVAKNVPERALTTEERLVSKCTFKPKLSKCSKIYSNVQPRLMSHFQLPGTERQNTSVIDNRDVLRRSFYSTVAEPLNVSATLSGIFPSNAPPINTRREMCNLHHIRCAIPSTTEHEPFGIY